MWGFGPALTRLGRDLGFTPFVISACFALYAVTLLYSRTGLDTGDILNLLPPSNDSLLLFGGSGAYPIFVKGRWWTVLTAGWLHANILHIGFNVMSIRNVAPIVADFFGASRMVIIYMLSSVAGFSISSIVGLINPPIPYFHGSAFTVGASAGITGLIGAILLYGRRAGNRHAGEQAKQWIWGFLAMGLMMQRIDNWAHLGGLAGGYLIAKLLDPLHPERMDHLLIAIGLLIVTVIAFAATILQGVPQFLN
jgi:rhomboid protease GluP